MGPSAFDVWNKNTFNFVAKMFSPIQADEGF